MEVIYEGEFPETFDCDAVSSECVSVQEGYQYVSDSSEEDQPSSSEMTEVEGGDVSDEDPGVGEGTPGPDTEKQCSFDVYNYSDDDDGFENFKEKVIV